MNDGHLVEELHRCWFLKAPILSIPSRPVQEQAIAVRSFFWIAVTGAQEQQHENVEGRRNGEGRQKENLLGYLHAYIARNVCDANGGPCLDGREGPIAFFHENESSLISVVGQREG